MYLRPVATSLRKWPKTRESHSTRRCSDLPRCCDSRWRKPRSWTTLSPPTSRSWDMANDYPIKPLGDFATVQGGFAFKSGDFTTTGTPVLKIKNIRLREVDTTDVAYVPPAVAQSASRYFCR